MDLRPDLARLRQLALMRFRFSDAALERGQVRRPRHRLGKLAEGFVEIGGGFADQEAFRICRPCDEGGLADDAENVRDAWIVLSINLVEATGGAVFSDRRPGGHQNGTCSSNSPDVPPLCRSLGRSLCRV